MFWPITACVLLPWLLVYLGLHVVQRGIIFVDIAMAQMASLGICLAVLLQFEPDSVTAYAIALGITLLGAAIFAITGKRATRVPQEAIIGISYVIAAAGAILLLSRSAHGNEEIRNMLVGDITVVSATEVWKCFAVFLVIGAVHFALRKKFLLVSFQRAEAERQQMLVPWWDFLFYATFGVVVTVFVRIAGVLLVFSYLIAPAVCAVSLARSNPAKLLIGWAVSLVGSIAGLFLSYWWDLPSGAAIVCTLGAMLVVTAMGSVFRKRMG
ncbi:MAG TPA: metal ABC transporter permease [Chthoniobacterales bacterium]|jgi:zinc/manganese transport system permease protein